MAIIRGFRGLLLLAGAFGVALFVGGYLVSLLRPACTFYRDGTLVCDSKESLRALARQNIGSYPTDGPIPIIMCGDDKAIWPSRIDGCFKEDRPDGAGIFLLTKQENRDRAATCLGSGRIWTNRGGPWGCYDVGAAPP